MPVKRRRNAASLTAAGMACVALVSGCLTPAIRYGRPKTSVVTEQGVYCYAGAGGSAGAVDADRLNRILGGYMGTPYRWGGMTSAGVDCSGLVCLVFKELRKVALPRSAADMIELGSPVEWADLRPGDLVFFRWGFFGRVDHVGIYTGEGRFVHASSSRGVIESSLNDGYYRTHFIGGRRLFA
jgi:cell wall-associated NlpC family hydrolase